MKRSYDMGRVQCVVVLFLYFFGGGVMTFYWHYCIGNLLITLYFTG